MISSVYTVIILIRRLTVIRCVLYALHMRLVRPIAGFTLVWVYCIRPKSFECDEVIFTLLSRSLLTRRCEISLPQKTSSNCQVRRSWLLYFKKMQWKLKTKKWGFALLDVPDPFYFMLYALVNPFRKFYFEGYIQTVFGSDPNKLLYNRLVNDIAKKEIKQTYAYDYAMLSKFFEFAAKLGGVSMHYYFYGRCYFQ